MTRTGRCLLAVAALFSAVYAVQIMVDIARPRVADGGSVVGLLDARWPLPIRVTFWAVLGSWVLAALLPLVKPMDPAVRRVAAAVILLLPFTVYPAATLGGHPLVLLVCLPSTAFGLWTVRRFQRYRKLPAGLLLAVFGWGALFAAGFGAANNLWALEYAPMYLLGGTMNPFRIAHEVNLWVYASAGIFEELGKGAGVALAYLLFRRYLDDVVAGVVLGAAAGLGFNLVESVDYIAAGSGPFQYWIRQSAGLLAAHVAFTALIGAGFGIARQLHRTGDRALVIGAGYVGAAGTHFANDTLLAWWGQAQPVAFAAAHPIVEQLVVQPVALAVLQGPLVAAYLLLRYRGLREQAVGLGASLRAEAGAIVPGEVPILLHPGRRLGLRIATLRRHGGPAVRALVRLQNAQYDLATQVWHQDRGDEPDGPPVPDLRDRVRSARLDLAHRMAVEVPA